MAIATGKLIVLVFGSENKYCPHFIISATRKGRDLIQTSKLSAGAPQSNRPNSSHHHDQYQDCQEHQKHPPSTRMFFMAPYDRYFWKPGGKIQYIGGDFRYHGCHHDNHESQEHPPWINTGPDPYCTNCDKTYISNNCLKTH